MSLPNSSFYLLCGTHPPFLPLASTWCSIIIMGMLTLIKRVFILCQVLHMSFHLNASSLISEGWESCPRQIIRKQNQYSDPVCLLPQPDLFTTAPYLEGSENAHPTDSVSVMEIIAYLWTLCFIFSLMRGLLLYSVSTCRLSGVIVEP